ncbi:hypothetical protein AtubIFM55763_010326 [Aspergillus tubingensis]|uniref:MARVEL domain-containing protein n=1 Tax=Aspergillus tubingensis TaxID=5068 RepID=UPI001577923E|nr:uncharacterized protein AtWU_06293 [Aspergillus tubingensis]GFN16492.1 hypothetical protein AtWU_06293 [Aspergillus tubingensis]GLA61804.1 hypothetical protein AtubIFM54640_002335 [Aspergillus tubingensis]GLA69807.1 hypothetical protein AtubIFM55763_010326 [Aspergillus tubingensis]GLA92585.1 hypothetical protein AtubIFM57143_008938 [Aspergillus tubingensis]GLB16034.1 hypothetical protein AtubIFM61612_005869 [Aspergillus tubingensis]
MHDYLGHPLGLAGWFARTIQAISSIIVLGITAWAVSEDNKTLSVIFSLVIATTSLVVIAVAVGISCLARRAKWHIIPLLVTDAIISYLWLTSFILLALNFNRRTCRVNRWIGEVSCSRSYTAEAFSFIAFFTTLMGLFLETAYIYWAKPDSVPQTEKRLHQERLSENLNAAGLT